MTNNHLVKATELWDSVTIGRQGGALVRLISPILTGEHDAAADARLQGFTTSLALLLRRKIVGR